MSLDKGMTIISEALLAVGIILVSMAFVIVGGNIISFQTEGLFSSTQNQMPEQITGIVNELPESSGEFSTTYEPEIDTYTLQVQENRTVTADIPDAGRSSTEFLDYRIENTVIRNADKICIRKNSNNISISSGSCDTGNLSTFCANGRCINNNCQPGKGETCANSGGDCSCPADSASPEASDTCKPDYKADNFINASGAGDSDLDATRPIGCVEKDYINAQSKGDRCEYDFECKGSNTCSSSTSSSGRCCPQGEMWNGSACTPTYQIVAVPIKYNLPSEMSSYKQDASDFEEFWERKSVFRTCNSPDKAVEVKTLSNTCSNDVSSACQGSFCSDACANAIIQCASNNYPNFDKAEGFYDGPGMSVSGGTVTGCSGKADLTLDNQGSSNGGAIHITGSGFESGKGVAHELGHDFGLCHGKSDSSWSNPSVKPCNPSIDSGCSGTGSTGTCIGCDSSYCPNDDPQDPADVMNYQNLNPPSKYNFKSQEDSHVSSFTEVQEVLNSCQ